MLQNANNKVEKMAKYLKRLGRIEGKNNFNEKENPLTEEMKINTKINCHFRKRIKCN